MSFRFSITYAAALATVLLLIGVSGVAGQTVRARVIDEASRQPVVSATVSFRRSGVEVARTTTGENGFFIQKLDPNTTYEIVLEHGGYGAKALALEFLANDTTLPAILLPPTAFRLDTIRAEATAARPEVTPLTTFQRSAHIIAGADMARLDQQGVSVLSAIRQFPLRIRQMRRGEYCIESTRRMMTMTIPPPVCEPMMLVLDGMLVGNVSEIQKMKLADMESLEYLTPVRAGLLYGLEAGSVGALVVWMRGSGPHRSKDRQKKPPQ